MHKIFLSWQSDIDHNTRLIKSALKNAIKQSEGYEYDEATRNELGAINIADLIIRKINECSIFVADLTIINKGSKFRHAANPNVLFELGYAMSCVGESNVVLITEKLEKNHPCYPSMFKAIELFFLTLTMVKKVWR